MRVRLFVPAGLRELPEKGGRLMSLGRALAIVGAILGVWFALLLCWAWLSYRPYKRGKR